MQILGSAQPDPATGSSTPAMPLFGNAVSAGFPSPAQDFIERTLDLNELCIEHPAATFFVRAEGDSMIEAGIHPGDILVVDRSLTARSGDVVIASLYGELTVKELSLGEVPQLVPRNASMLPMTIAEGSSCEILGVVTFVLHGLRTKC